MPDPNTHEHPRMPVLQRTIGAAASEFGGGLLADSSRGSRNNNGEAFCRRPDVLQIRQALQTHFLRRESKEDVL